MFHFLFLFLNHCGIILKYGGGGGSVNRCVVVVICFFFFVFFFRSIFINSSSKMTYGCYILYDQQMQNTKLFFSFKNVHTSFSFVVPIHLMVTIHRRLQGRAFLGFCAGHKTARMASSNTCLRPLWVNAEHSRYLTAPTSLAIDKPWKNVSKSKHITKPSQAFIF